jgi:alpha-glucosidase (family GH31 glycosyl hydrolase)
MTEQITIVHSPYGTDAPYFAGPEERAPRDPVGGDMVGVGFLTAPGRAAEMVRLHWTRNGRPQTPILGRPVAQAADADRWLVELGVVEAGDTVEYWIVASAGGQAIESPRYRFTARRWRRLATITAAEHIDGDIRLETLGDDGRPGPTLTIRRTSVGQMLQVRIGPAAPPATNAPAPAAAVDLRGDGVALRIQSATGQMLFSGIPDDDAAPPIALTMRWLEEGDGRLAAVELVGPLEVDEALVGFGERFDALDQRGRAPDVVVYEQYKNQGNRTYMPIPFFCSSRGYGCLVEGAAYVGYDLGRTIHDRWRCVAQAGADGQATIDLFAGSPIAILRSFTQLVGRPELPPAWAFGPWMSSNEWNTQARVEAEVSQTRAHAIPATVLVIEAWSDETTFYTWNGARYTPRDGATAPRLADFTFPADGPWPDPKGMADALHDAGIRLILWQIPALKRIEDPHPQHDADVAHALEHGYVLRNDDGQPYRNPGFWFNQALIPDFTSAAATTWWLGKRAYLLDEMGVDGFKTDGSEHLQGRGIRASDGRRGGELVNAYPNLYVGAYYRFARERRGGDALTFSRAGHTGAGAFPAHWAGDENSTWEAFRRSIVAGLSAGLSGVPFWGWDIAGFSEDLPSAELYLRATAMAAFCPIMQYHSEYTPPGAPSKDRTPWHIQAYTGDDRVVALYRFFARLRMNLLPYIVSEAAHCVASGEPLLRPLLLDDPDDPQTWRIQDQYRFGRDLLVAPIVEEGATTRRLYLPRGRWHDLWDAGALEGGRWIEVDAPLDRIPVYVRAGAVLPLRLGALGAFGDDMGNTIDPTAPVTLWVYPAGRSSYEWTDLAGVRRRIQVAQEADGSTVVIVPAIGTGLRLARAHGHTVIIAPSSGPQHVTLR